MTMTNADRARGEAAEDPGPSSTTAGPEIWADVEQQLVEWGEQLERLWAQSRETPDPDQDKIILDLETKYNALRQDISALQARVDTALSRSGIEAHDRRAALDQAKDRVADLQDTASEKAREVTGHLKEGVDDLIARVRSGEALDDIRESSDKLKAGAVEVGDGLARAWGELKHSFESAGAKMKAKPEEDAD